MARVKFLDFLKPAPTNYRGRPTYDELMNAESEFGRTLFGPIPAGHQREFFKSRGDVWIWHEGWTDENGLARGTTLCYEVRKDGVYKKTTEAGAETGVYEKIKGRELSNFITAVRAYRDLVKTKMYGA